LKIDDGDIAEKQNYYFYDNKLIDQITTGHNRFEDDHIDTEKKAHGLSSKKQCMKNILIFLGKCCMT
jgi:hypothetical protein